ncbi:MAG TPA: type II secretion system secretin GspD, partial [Steroidobacteraceae bacterium]|nr:type II secretion system secretin GspD [Steroidobacteraceae bacterium]
AAEPAPSLTPSGVGYQLAFSDADVAIVVGAILGDGLGVPYVIDPQVKGNVTLQASRPLTREELLPTLEAALRVQGAAIVVVNDVYNVVPVKDAARRITGISTARGNGYSIQIVSPRYVSATEIEKLLQPFAPEGGILRVDESRNLMMLAGTGQEIATMMEVIKTFDVDWLAGMSFGLFPLESVDARTIATELESIFGDTKGPLGNIVRFTPLSRLNSLMVVTPQPKYLADVESWIRRLDVGSATPGRRIYVYEVQNGKADELGASLSKILNISYEGTSSAGGSGGSGGAGFSNSSGLGGNAGGGPGNGFGGGGSVQSPAARAPNYSAAASTGGGGGDANSVRIVPSPENNALLINATPTEYSVIEQALKRLDTRPIQVLIEASLAEVTLTDDMRYGLQWSYQGGDGPVVLSESSSGGIAPAFPGFSYLFTGRTDIRAVLNAIESLTNVRVISNPKLLVLNNREAQLQIGDQVPVTVQSAIGTVGDNSPIVNSVQFRDTGVILRVTPRVNKSGLVILDVAQEVSDVVPTTTSGIDSPTIQQRKFNSTVAVQDGETIALGGLIRESRSRGGSGLPFLRRIPLLGELFGSTQRNGRRTELIVLMTPKVIKSADDSAELLEKMRQDFKSLRQVLPQWRGEAGAPRATVPAPAAVAPAAPAAANGATPTP